VPTHQVLNDLVLVKEIKDEDKTEGGVFLPQTLNKTEATAMGHVIAVGNGRMIDNGERVPPPVSVGDKIIYKWRLAQPIKDSAGEDFVFVQEGNILAVVEEE